MKFSSAVVLSWILGASVLLAPAVAADPPPNFNECGTVARPELIEEAERIIAEARLGRRQGGGITDYIVDVFVGREYIAAFHVYWHAIAANMTTAGGSIPQSQIDAQMKMMTDAYVGTGVSWNLVGVTRVLNRNWYETLIDENPKTLQMQDWARQGDARVLNVYSVGFAGSNLNGYATFPFDYAKSPIEDGLVLRWETVPGGTSPVRQGCTLLHEAGHWLGLYHTFQGGRTGPGDEVDDTPPGPIANFGCPIGVDSCAGDSFPDPIHNYMDYTDETCRTEFTPGQINRMQEIIRAFRA